MNQTNHSTNYERPCTTTHRIEKEPSICQSFPCPGRVSFPVLSQIKPLAPLLVVPFRQFNLSFSFATILPPEPKDSWFPPHCQAGHGNNATNYNCLDARLNLSPFFKVIWFSDDFH
ncbi:hypothetical protein QQF64_034140 [Cirrhinus molitorella]|uniref:Uncharacterized protein n=1 Tax=Cirrhinus molitorella TaxID=172907 RepID=A0ABR3MVY5_9TELE